MANFFSEHPVFSLEEIKSADKSSSSKSVHNKLKYYLKKRQIMSLKPGLYYVIPDGSSPDRFYPDSIHIVSRLSNMAVVAFHSAFEVMGYGHNIFHRFFYYSSIRRRRFRFKDDEFVCVFTPRKLLNEEREMFGVAEKYYNNLLLKFTNRERTFVDCLDKQKYGGGIEEIYRCVEKYPYLKFDGILEYLHILGKKILFSKVGFFLQQHRKQFYVTEDILNELRRRKPDSLVYFDSERKKGKQIKEWNLIVPEIIIKKGWEES